MNERRLVEHLRQVRKELRDKGQDHLADGVAKAIAEVEQASALRAELDRCPGCLGL